MFPYTSNIKVPKMAVTKRSMMQDFGLILSLVAVGLGAWSISNVVKLQSEVAKLSAPVDYDKLVESSMARIHKQKIVAQTTKNLADWQTASDLPVSNRIKLYGNPTARFTIVEYSDLECPFCRSFHATPKYLVDNSKGNVNWQWKHLPLSFHEPLATNGALASECVYDQKGSQGFWAFTDQWFKLSQGNGKGPLQSIGEIAASVGVDTDTFDSCVSSSTHQSFLSSEKEYASKIGLTGTPASMIVDNLTGKRVFVKGAQPISNYAKAINELAQSGKENSVRSSVSEFDEDRIAVSGQARPLASPADN